jgi:hypothetical protein
MTYKEALEKIATVNAMDYEYQAWAREALANHIPDETKMVSGVKDFLTTQQEQGEPVAMQMDVIVVNLVREGINKHRARELAEHFIKHTTPQPKQEQGEPVAIVVADKYEDGSHAGNHLEWSGRNEANDFPEGTAFYTTPQQRKPLTDEQILSFVNAAPALETAEAEWLHVARAIEAAHGIKE